MSSKKFNNNPSLAYITAPEQPVAEETKKPELKPEPEITPVRGEKREQVPQKKYMRLDITDYQEYISLMAAYTSKTTGKYTSMTQYILKLIEADKQANTALYSKLQAIEQMKDEL